MSRRVVMMTLDQPEGPFVPTSLTATSMLDGRGVAGPTVTVPIGSRLRDPGAIVTGRVFHADGTPVAGGSVIYEQNPDFKECQPQNGLAPLSRIVLDAAGGYELRYVRRDTCGYPFSIVTTDPSSGAVVSASRNVRSTELLASPERIVVDLAMFGHGNVTGIVRNLQGQPVSAASVAVASLTDNQVGATAVTDGDGRYTVTGITVGPITVRAAKQTSQGHSGGRIERAGTTTQVDVTLDGGTVSIKGVVTTLNGAVRKPAPQVIVAYYLAGGSSPQAVAFTTTNNLGYYEMSGLPTGAFQVRATLDLYSHAMIDGTAVAGDTLVRDIAISLAETATITGTVQLPSGQPATQVYVTASGRAVEARADGTFTLPNIPLGQNIRVAATTFDMKRSAATSVSLTVAGQTVNAALVLSGLGRATFTVADSAGNPLPNVLVTRLDCSSVCGCDGKPTDAQGKVTFEGVNIGRLTARAFQTGGGDRYGGWPGLHRARRRHGAGPHPPERLRHRHRVRAR